MINLCGYTLPCLFAFETYLSAYIISYLKSQKSASIEGSQEVRSKLLSDFLLIYGDCADVLYLVVP
jgi:hypothetical protein